MSTALASEDHDFAPLLDAIDEQVEVETVRQLGERALVEGFVAEGLLSRRAAITIARRFCCAVLDGARGETDEIRRYAFTVPWTRFVVTGSVSRVSLVDQNRSGYVNSSSVGGERG